MLSEEKVRMLLHTTHVEAAKYARTRAAEPNSVMTIEDHEAAARFAGMAAALAVVLEVDGRPDWEFLDTIADEP